MRERRDDGGKKYSSSRLWLPSLATYAFSSHFATRPHHPSGAKLRVWRQTLRTLSARVSRRRRPRRAAIWLVWRVGARLDSEPRSESLAAWSRPTRLAGRGRFA
jgi:hypothetical protein